MENLPTHDVLNQDVCFSYIAEHVFRYQDAEYSRKHKIWPGKVGIELEMQAFKNQGDKVPPIPLPLDNHSPRTSSLSMDSVKSLLIELAISQGWTPEYFENTQVEVGQERVLEKIVIGKEAITFEPGGQIEFSTKPFNCLDDACNQLASVQKPIKEFFNKKGYDIIQLGMNPWQTMAQTPLQMRKKRYLAMAEHFGHIGPYGHEMMRQTMSIQVNLDFGQTEQELVERYLCANIAAPFATAIFANSPIKAGALTDFRGNRCKAWHHLDPSRTGFPDLDAIFKSPRFDTCARTYLEFALNASVVFIQALDYEVPAQPVTFRQWMQDGYKGVKPNLEDFKTHLTLLFPEVRPKGFLEIRSPDCLFSSWQFVPATFLVSLIYDAENCQRLLQIHDTKAKNLDFFWQNAACGLSNPELADIAYEIMELAIAGIERLPDCFKGDGLDDQLKRFATRYTLRKRCPADDLIDLMNKSGQLTINGLKNLEHQISGL